MSIISILIFITYSYDLYLYEYEYILMYEYRFKSKRLLERLALRNRWLFFSSLRRPWAAPRLLPLGATSPALPNAFKILSLLFNETQKRLISLSYAHSYTTIYIYIILLLLLKNISKKGFNGPSTLLLLDGVQFHKDTDGAWIAAGCRSPLQKGCFHLETLKDLEKAKLNFWMLSNDIVELSKTDE